MCAMFPQIWYSRFDKYFKNIRFCDWFSTFVRGLVKNEFLREHRAIYYKYRNNNKKLNNLQKISNIKVVNIVYT